MSDKPKTKYGIRIARGGMFYGMVDLSRGFDKGINRMTGRAVTVPCVTIAAVMGMLAEFERPKRGYKR